MQRERNKSKQWGVSQPFCQHKIPVTTEGDSQWFPQVRGPEQILEMNEHFTACAFRLHVWGEEKGAEQYP